MVLQQNNKALEKKLKGMDRKKLRLPQSNVNADGKSRTEPIAKDELKHPAHGKRPATENGDLCSQKKKSKVMLLEEKMDDDAGNGVGEPEVKSKKKRNPKKATGTERRKVSKKGVNSGVDVSEVDSALEAKADKSEERRYTKKASKPFESLRGTVSDVTLQAIEKMGIKTMTEMQEKAIPPALEGKDVQGIGERATDKILSYSIPIVELLSKEKFTASKGTGAIVIAPNEELCVPIFYVLRKLLEGRSQTLALIIGCANFAIEGDLLKKGACVIVATPQRLRNHIRNTPNFVFKSLKCLVIDEFGIMDKYGYKDLEEILMSLPDSRQTLLFSATTNNYMYAENLSRLALKAEPVKIKVDADGEEWEAALEGFEQVCAVCPSEKRFQALCTFLEENKEKKIIVFFSTRKAEVFYRQVLKNFGLPVKSLDDRQYSRLDASPFFKFFYAETGILVCTHKVTRRWDIPDVDFIVQYDPPNNLYEYIRLVGRSPRAVGKGKVLLLLREEEAGFIEYMENHKVNVDRIEITCKDDEFQSMLEENVKYGYLTKSAKVAMKTYCRYYQYLQLQQYFDYRTLNADKIAKNFGIVGPVKLPKKFLEAMKVEETV